MKSALILIVLLVVSSVAQHASADNGELALARPLDQITIDGDFADWPASLPWYSIERAEFAASPRSFSDFNARFRIGYDKDALYLAVEVQDDSTITDGTRNWDSQDGCSVYLDVEHGDGDTGTIQFNIYGDGSPPSEAGQQVATWSCQRSGALHRYEWRFDIKRLSRSQKEFKPGRVIGMDVSLCDRDRDGSFSWVCWGTGTNKDVSSSRLGDVLLVSADVVTGRVRGRFTDVTGGDPLHHFEVRLHRETQTSPLTLRSGSDGEFSVVLPVGKYRVATSAGAILGRIEVDAGGESSVDFHTTATMGQKTIAVQAIAVAVGSSTGPGPLHDYRSEDGLPGGAVRGFAQAADGSMLIAGRAGLARFDGRSMTLLAGVNGAPAPCDAVTIDHSGNTWVGTHMGLYRYDGESFTRFTRAHGLAPGSITQLIPVDDGSLWIRTHHGISRYDGDSFTIIRERSSSRWWLSTMAVESSSRVWLATTAGLVRLDAHGDKGKPNSWRETRFGTEDGLAGDNVRALLFDSQGQLWIGSIGGLTRYDGESFKSWTTHDGLSHEAVFALTETDDGRVWVGTMAGLDEFSDGHFTHVEDTKAVRELYADREQNIWIAARSSGPADPSQGGGGLFRFDSDRPTYLQQLESKPIVARTLMQTRDGALWAGTRRGLVYQKGPITKRYTTADGLVDAEVRCLLEDSQGGVWIGTQAGVCRFDGRQFEPLSTHSGPIADQINVMAEDTTGRIWIGTAEGITVYDPPSVRDTGPDGEDRDTEASGAPLSGHVSHLTTVDGLQHNGVNSLLADSDGSVWIGTSIGICRWQDDSVQRFDTPNNVNCLLQDDANERYAGADGLFHFDGNRWNRVVACGTAPVVALAHDAVGRLWMATNSGLKVYDGFAVQTFTQHDAMPESCQDVLWDDTENAVIVAGEGLARYRPQRRPPPIAITRVTADKPYEAVNGVRFSSSQPYLGFAFHGTSFKTRPGAMRYRYRLRGFENEWKLTDSSRVSYGRLPAGNYTFEVFAIDRDLTYSDQPALVRVRVDRDYRQAALWSSWVCAIIAVALLGMMVVKRNRGIRRMNVELDQRVTDRTAKLEWEIAENRKLHEQLLQTQKLDAVGTMASGIAHDFNNSLAVITGFAEVARTTSSDSHEFLDHILTAAKQAAGTTRNLLTFSRDSPGEKVPRDIVQLVRETSDFLRKMLPASIKLRSVLRENATVWCSVDTAHIQQVLVNVAMNARDALPDGGEISISAGPHATRPGFAELVITDNGTGMPEQVRERIFDPFFTTKSRGQGTGLGMAIVHGIIEDHQGTIEIQSSAAQGTTVSIALPQCPPEESKSEPPAPVMSGLGETILVAEDNLEVQAMIEAQLRSADFDVLNANDGEHALRLLQQHGFEVRLALLDIDLPKMDGKACLKEINARFPHLPAIMMSGLSSVDPALLATPFLRKPFDRHTLLSTINLALHPEPVEHACGVLVIDDDDLVRVSTKAVLACNDLDVYLAKSGVEGVAQLRANIDRIGTVLLDWNLPDSDPESILQALRNESPHVRVLVVSGDLALQPHQVEAKGFSRLLRKPVSSSELLEAVGLSSVTAF